MKKLIGFLRPDDLEYFSLNEDDETFSLEFMKKKWPNNLHFKFPKDTLIKLGFYEVYLNVF